MTNPLPDTPATRGLSRRTVNSIAWTVPAVAVAVGTPAAATSPTGAVVIVAPTPFVQPGTPYPNLSVELHFTGAGIVPTDTAAVTITLPDGFAWATPGPAARTLTATGGVVPLVGPNAVIAPIDYTHTAGTITAAAVDTHPATGHPASYTPDTATLTTKFNGGGGGTGGGPAATWSIAPGNAFANQIGVAYLALLPNVYPAGAAPITLGSYPNYFSIGATANGTEFFRSRYPGPNDYQTMTRAGLLPGEQWYALGPMPQTEMHVLTSYGRILTGDFNTNTSRSLSGAWGWGPERFIMMLAGSYQPGPSPVGNTQTYYALDRTGVVWAWGSGYNGQLGDGTNTGNTDTPVLVLTAPNTPLQGVVQIEGFSGGCVARLADGTVASWGHNESGQLGNGSISGLSTYAQPVLDAAGGPLTGVSMLGHQDVDGTTATSYYEGAVTAIKGGMLYSWGSGLGMRHVGGDVTPRTLAAPNAQAALLLSNQPAGTTVRDAHSARNSTVVILSNGTVWSWGENNDAQLADGTKTNRSAPVPVHINVGPNGDQDGGLLLGTFFDRASGRSPVVLGAAS